jgi:hypothetical protein
VFSVFEKANVERNVIWDKAYKAYKAYFCAILLLSVKQKMIFLLIAQINSGENIL